MRKQQKCGEVMKKIVEKSSGSSYNKWETQEKSLSKNYGKQRSAQKNNEKKLWNFIWMMS